MSMRARMEAARVELAGEVDKVSRGKAPNEPLVLECLKRMRAMDVTKSVLKETKAGFTVRDAKKLLARAAGLAWRRVIL